MAGKTSTTAAKLQPTTMAAWGDRSPRGWMKHAVLHAHPSLLVHS